MLARYKNTSHKALPLHEITILEIYSLNLHAQTPTKSLILNKYQNSILNWNFCHTLNSEPAIKIMMEIVEEILAFWTFLHPAIQFLLFDFQWINFLI